MGYLSIFLALIAGSTKGLFGKKISNTASTYRQAIFVNIIRMLICSVIGIFLLIFDREKGSVIFDTEAVIYGALAGISMAVFVVTWLLAVRHGAYMLISVAQMFGVVVTLLCSFAVFRESVLPRQILAVGILVVAVLIMVSYSTGLKGKLSAGAIVLLVLCGVSSGVYDFSLKLFTHFSQSSISVLNILTYIISMLGMLLVFVLPAKNDRFDTKKLFSKTIRPLLIMSVCLFANSYFKALSNNYLSATQVYPIYQAGGLILSAGMSSVFFKEKITPRCVFGLVLAFISILLLK